MKKILIIISILLLSGCFENSGYITKTCTKKEIANTLETNTTYTFKFKNDIIEEISVLREYNDTDKVTINSIKTSVETQNKYLDLNYEVLSNTDNQYKINYNIDINSSDEILDKFMIKKKRSELVNNLKDNGFTCE